MALSKAAGVIHTRTLLRAKGDSAEKAFLVKLTPDEALLYQNSLPIGKLPIETAVKLFELAVPILYPDQPLAAGLRQLGYATALHDMNGIYKIFLRMATPEFVMRQTAKIWKTYHDAGESSIEPLGAKSVRLILRSYPDLPRNFMEVVHGYSLGMLELVGAKNPRIQNNDSNPEAWSWTISWD